MKYIQVCTAQGSLTLLYTENSLKALIYQANNSFFLYNKKANIVKKEAYTYIKRGMYMLILSKKRMLIMTCLIFVSLYAFSFKIANNMVDIKETEKTVTTVSTPVSNKVVIVDAGHGTPDEGAESSSGTTEAEINLKIALKLQQLLEQSGCTVLLTRSDENAIYDAESSSIREKKISDMHNRVKIGNNSNADIFVSIHLNKIEQSQYDGWQTFYKKGNEDSKTLATMIQNNLNNTISKENNRIPAQLNTVYLMKYVEIPITIVECGFLSNPEEEKLLQTDEYQNRLAWGIYNGINDYFNL